MSEGVLKDYKFSQKNNWRWLIWKHAAKHLNPKTARVLLLSGAACNDLYVLLSLGFQMKNVISIEADKSAAREARKKFAVLTFCGSVSDFLRYAPEEYQFELIFLDYCGGLTFERLDDLQLAFNRLNPSKAMIGANFLRGRDQATQMFREETLNHFKRHRGKLAYLKAIAPITSKCEEEIARAKGESGYVNARWDLHFELDLPPSERNLQWLLEAQFPDDGLGDTNPFDSGLMRILKACASKKTGNHPSGNPERHELCIQRQKERVSELEKNKPERWSSSFRSYKSGPVYMDSFIAGVSRKNNTSQVRSWALELVMETWVKKNIDAHGLNYVRNYKFPNNDNRDVLDKRCKSVVRSMIGTPRLLAAAKAVQSRQLITS